MQNSPLQKSNRMDFPRLYSAPWVFPISSPPISGGAVVVENNRIKYVGKLPDITSLKNYDHVQCSGILMPALINAHIHLELSHLKNLPCPKKGQTMVDWIEKLLQERNTTVEESYVKKSRQEILDQQYLDGCIVLMDIGNAPVEKDSVRTSKPEIIHLLEFLGPTRDAIDHVRKTTSSLDPSISVTGHAPYSTPASLLQHLKTKATRDKTLFSLHIAESRDEKEFILFQTGSFRDFLERRDAWDGSFITEELEFDGVVEYLDQLKVLDSNTLCVHCVHITDKEIELLSKRKCSVCLCPGSNRFLGVGKAPVMSMLKNGITCAIGTDSLASNEKVNMWREMAILKKDHPSLAASTIIEMATLGGAKAIQREDDLGSLQVGKAARFLHVEVDFLNEKNNLEYIYKELISMDISKRVKWIEH